jgi:hypothetical protein
MFSLRGQVEISRIATLLAQLDSDEPLRTSAILLEYRGEGGSEPFNCKAEDGFRYVVKCQNNPQDLSSGLPLKILITELVCGRLGQLFNPPICPLACIVDILEEQASALTYSNGERPSAGPSFGSRLVDSVIDIKFGGDINVVPPEQAARVIMFQTWLRGEDTAALVSTDSNGKIFQSIDHGYYLTGSQWNEGILVSQPAVSLVQPPSFQEMMKLEKRAIVSGCS